MVHDPVELFVHLLIEHGDARVDCADQIDVFTKHDLVGIDRLSRLRGIADEFCFQTVVKELQFTRQFSLWFRCAHFFLPPSGSFGVSGDSSTFGCSAGFSTSNAFSSSIFAFISLRFVSSRSTSMNFCCSLTLPSSLAMASDSLVRFSKRALSSS